eukprot:5063173-Prymnesium_polylepis.1
MENRPPANMSREERAGLRPKVKLKCKGGTGTAARRQPTQVSPSASPPLSTGWYSTLAGATRAASSWSAGNPKTHDRHRANRLQAAPVAAAQGALSLCCV